MQILSYALQMRTASGYTKRLDCKLRRILRRNVSRPALKLGSLFVPGCHRTTMLLKWALAVVLFETTKASSPNIILHAL